MRKPLLAFGIVLVLVGIVVSSACSSSYVELTKRVEVTQSEEKWNATGYFNKKEKLIVDLSSPTREYVPDGEVNFSVTIIDPMGGASVFLVTYNHQYKIFRRYTLTSSAEGLLVDEPITLIGGTVQYDGNYTVHVGEMASWLYEDAPLLGFSKEVIEKEYPYYGIVPAGIAIIIFGALLSMWAAKTSDRVRAGSSRKRAG